MKTAKRTWKYKYRREIGLGTLRNDANRKKYIDAYKLIATDLEGYEYNLKLMKLCQNIFKTLT
jgi:hypothetical protein